MASQKSQKSKRARKPRNSRSAPRAVVSDRREVRADRHARREALRHRSHRQLGREGERPPGLFGALPVSELAILLGLVAAVIGFVEARTLVLVVGLVVCGLGTIEVVGREHFSGYRSHTALLAAIPAVGIEAAIVVIAGDPRQRSYLLAVIVPLFAGLYWLLRKQFQIARQARVARAARGGPTD